MQESSLFGARFFSSCKIRALQGFCSHKPKSGFWRTLAGGTAIQVANKSQSAGISLPSASLSLSLSRFLFQRQCCGFCCIWRRLVGGCCLPLPAMTCGSLSLLGASHTSPSPSHLSSCHLLPLTVCPAGRCSATSRPEHRTRDPLSGRSGCRSFMHLI